MVEVKFHDIPNKKTCPKPLQMTKEKKGTGHCKS